MTLDMMRLVAIDVVLLLGWFLDYHRHIEYKLCLILSNNQYIGVATKHIINLYGKDETYSMQVKLMFYLRFMH